MRTCFIVCLCCLLLLASEPAKGSDLHPARKLLQEQWWSSWWCEGTGCDQAPNTPNPPSTPPSCCNETPLPENCFCPLPAGQTGNTQPGASPSAPQGQGSPCPDQQAVLNAHNQARAARGTQPLQWDSGLANDAAQWSGQCNRDSFGYSHAQGINEGENLGWFENRGNQCVTAVQSWISEQSQWSPSNPVNYAAGHWTQVVWKATTRVGCGIALCRQGQWGPEYLVTCRYSPPGNFGGTSDYVANI